MRKVEGKEYHIHSNIYNVIMGFILKSSQLLFPLITFPYVTRILLSEGVGKVSFAQSVIEIFSMIAMLGIPLYGIKACARVRDDNIQLATTVKELLIINTIAMSFSFLLLFFSILFISKLSDICVLLSVFSIKIILTVFGVEWFYQAIEQYDYITIRSVLGKLVAIILLFFIVKDSSDVIAYSFVLVVGTVGSNIFNIFRLHKFISFREINKCNIKRHIKPLFVLFAFSATTTIYHSVATVFVGFLSSEIDVGYFTTATKVRTLLPGVITVASSVLLPRTSYLLTQNRKSDFFDLLRNSFNFNLLLAIPISILCIIKSYNIILILAGRNFVDAVLAMQIVMPSVVLVGLTNVIGIQLFLPLNKENFVFISTLIGAIVNIILNFFLIPSYGVNGAAFSTTITELIVLFVQYMFLIKLKIKLFDIKEFLKITGVSFVVAFAVVRIVPCYENMWKDIIVTSIVYCMIVMLLLVVVREKLVLSFVNKILISRRSDSFSV